MGRTLSNSRYLKSICPSTAISRIQVFRTFLKIRKWANIQESTSYDRRLPVKGLYYSITSPSQSSSWPNLMGYPSGYQLNLPGMVAIYFEVSAIMQPACNCFALLDCESDREQLAQPDLMLLSYRLNFSGICFYTREGSPFKFCFQEKCLFTVSKNGTCSC
jgi:hypothetical protein